MDVFSKVNKWLVWGMGIVFAMGFQSCLDDDNDNWYGKVIPNALVTVKTWMMVRFPAIGRQHDIVAYKCCVISFLVKRK